MRTYRIARAAELAGLSEEVIRAWERRYGVPRPQRTPTGYRVYTEADIAVLRRLKQLTEDGMAIREAAALVPAFEAETAPAEDARNGAAPAEVARWHRAIVGAAHRLDQAAVDDVLGHAFAALSPLAVYDLLLVPLERELGRTWQDSRLGVTEEHLVSHAVRTRLATILQTGPRAARRHALCACFPEELHDLGLFGAALRLREAGCRITFLGQRVPVKQLVGAMRAVEPDVVALACVTDPGADALRETLAAIAAGRPRRTVIIAGGVAAERHHESFRRAKIDVVAEDADWRTVLGRLH
jgi:DNA-binding transcriptional MerR regulator/methylmalonyl-CoA mutase cobalamin-binding subunit